MADFVGDGVAVGCSASASCAPMRRSRKSSTRAGWPRSARGSGASWWRRHDAGSVAVVGAGPAGLMAADVLQSHGAQVHVFDAMPSVGRKFLLAGIGGLNLTHSEAMPGFLARYAQRAPALQPHARRLRPRRRARLGAGAGHRDLRRHLGPRVPDRHEGRAAAARVAASPARGRRRPAAGAVPHAPSLARLGRRRRDAALRARPTANWPFAADATVLALGGASWSRLGSDGAWVPLLAARGVDIAPLRAEQLRLRRRAHRRRPQRLERAPARALRRRAA